MPIDSVLIGEHALCESLADDHDRLLVIILIVERIEVASGDDGNAERRKKSRRDDTPLRPGILYAGGMGVTIPGELKTIAAITPRNHIAECSFAHARQSINAAHRFLVEIDDLSRSLTVRHSGNVDGQDVLRVQTRLSLLQCDQRSDQGTCTGQQHERGGDLRHREDSLPAARAGYPETSAGWAQ